MRKRNGAEEKLYLLLEDTVRECGVELIDLKRETENSKCFLRLYLDKRGGISIDDCERVSQLVDPILDAAGEDWHDYLEVQSPGLDRPLQDTRDLRLHLDENVELSLYQKVDGEKQLSGILHAADETTLVLLDAAGNPHSFERKDIAKVTRSLRMDK